MPFGTHRSQSRCFAQVARARGAQGADHHGNLLHYSALMQQYLPGGCTFSERNHCALAENTPAYKIGDGIHTEHMPLLRSPSVHKMGAALGGLEVPSSTQKRINV